MRYQNKKTGAWIDTPCVVRGGDWEEVPAEPKRRLAPRAKTKEKKEKAQ